MATTVIDRLEGVYIRRFDRFFLIYPFAVSGWIVGLSQIFDKQVITLIVTISVGLYYAALLLALTLRLFRHRIARDREHAAQVKIRSERDRLAGTLARKHRTDTLYYHHQEWHEKIHIKANGNTTIKREISIAPGSEGIDLAFLNLYGNAAPDNQEDVTFTVSLVAANGDSLNADYLEWWEEEKKHTVFVFLDHTYRPGETVRILATWVWPGYSKQLMSGIEESHRILLSRACDDFRAELKIDKVNTYENKRPHVIELQAPEVTTNCTVTQQETANNYVIELRSTNQNAQSSFGVKIVAAG